METGGTSGKKLSVKIPQDSSTLSDFESFELIKQQGDKLGISSWEIDRLIELCESKNCLHVGFGVLSEYATLQDQVILSFNLQRAGHQELIRYMKSSESPLDIKRVSGIILSLALHLLTFYVSLCRWRKLQWSPHSFSHKGVDVMNADAYTVMMKKDIESLLECLRVSGLMSELVGACTLELAIVTSILSDGDKFNDSSPVDNRADIECIKALKAVFRNEEKIEESWKTCANKVQSIEQQNEFLGLFPTLRLPYSNIKSPDDCMDWFSSSIHVYIEAANTLERIFGIISEKHSRDDNKDTSHILDVTDDILTNEEAHAVMIEEKIEELNNPNTANSHDDINNDDDNDINEDGNDDDGDDNDEGKNIEDGNASPERGDPKKKKRRKKRKKTKTTKQNFIKAVDKVVTVNRVMANTFTRKIDTIPGVSGSNKHRKLPKKNDKVLKVSMSVDSSNDSINQNEDREEGPIDVEYDVTAANGVKVIRKLEISKSENLVFIQNMTPFSDQIKLLLDENTQDLSSGGGDYIYRSQDVNKNHRKSSKESLTKVEALASKFLCFRDIDIHSLVSSSFSRAEAKAESHIMVIALRNISIDENHLKNMAVRKLQAWVKIYLPMKTFENTKRMHRETVKMVKKIVTGLVHFAEIECQRRKKKRRSIQRNLAAIKIQRIFRSYREILLTKRSQEQLESASEVQTADERGLLEAIAAVKIQCRIRIFLACKLTVWMEESMKLHSHKMFETKMTEMMIQKMRRFEALVVMQKTWRGYQVRNTLYGKMKAAHKILVAYRMFKRGIELKERSRRREQPISIVLNYLRGIPDGYLTSSQIKVKISVWWHPLLHIMGDNDYSTITSSKKPQFIHITNPVYVYKPIRGSLESIEFISPRLSSITSSKAKHEGSVLNGRGDRKSTIRRKDTINRRKSMKKAVDIPKKRQPSKIEKVSISSMLSMYDDEDSEKDSEEDSEEDSIEEQNLSSTRTDGSPESADEKKKRKDGRSKSFVGNLSLKSMFAMYSDGYDTEGSRSDSSDERELVENPNASTRSSKSILGKSYSFVAKIRDTMNFNKQSVTGTPSMKNSCKFADVVVHIPTCHGNSVCKFEFLDGDAILGSFIFNIAKYGNLMYSGGEYSTPIELQKRSSNQGSRKQTTPMIFDYMVRTCSPRIFMTEWVHFFARRTGVGRSIFKALLGRWERRFITYNGQTHTLLIFESKSKGIPMMDIPLFEALENIRCEIGNPISTSFGKVRIEDTHNVILTLMNEEISLRFSDSHTREHWRSNFESVLYQKNLKHLASQGIVVNLT